MKTVAALLILAYLAVPALCFGHPYHGLSAGSPQASAAVSPSDTPPVAYDSDTCEASCCCAEHLPATSLLHPDFSFPDQPSPSEARLALPRVIYRIFVPPQNRPEITLPG
jgi:hypothetical protein